MVSRTGRARARACAAGALAWTLAGCAALQPAPSSHVRDHGRRVAVELAAVPFFPQEAHECGPAALATILQRSGVDITPEALEPEVFLPGREGTLTPELVAAVRRHGRLPERLPANLDSLFDALAAGRPVLVLQNLGLSWLPRLHYAVVVGYDLGRQELLLRSGSEPRQPLSLFTFEQTWQRAGGFALTALRPEEAPLFAASEVWLRTLSEAKAPARAWEAAVQRWPRSGAAALGLANARLAERPGDLKAVEQALRDGLAAEPEFLPAYNNLALILARQGNWSEARRVLEGGRQRLDTLPRSAGNDAMKAQFEDSARQIAAGRLSP